MIPGKLTRMRAVEPADLSLLKEIANDRFVASLVVGWSWPLSDYGQGKWWEGAHNSANTKRFMVEDFDGNAIGMTGLWDIDWHNRHALTALKLHPERVQRGMGTDAIKLLMAYAFHDVGLNRLWGAILDFNGPSFGAYVKKCGWKIEGCLRQEIWRDGAFHDLYRVAVLKDEFYALPDAQEYIDRLNPVDSKTKVDLPADWWAEGSGEK